MDLTDTQRQIRDTARAFAEREIAPHAAEWDRAKATPRALFGKMAEVGLMGVCVDPKYGGAGADFVAYILAMVELSAADGGIANVMAANNSPVAAALQQHGSDWQKENYLTKLCSGEWIGAFHLTEPHTGSDAAAIRTRAVRDGDDWVLNGQKAFITSGALSDLSMIVAVTDAQAGKRGITTFITPSDNPGYTVIREEEKLGHRTNDTSQIVFEDMRVPGRDVLGEPGRGLAIALANLSAGRIGVAAQAVGGARAALKAARAYAAERETFGKPIIEHQAIAFMLAEMATEIEAARALTLQAARSHAAGEDSAREASMAKLFASEMAERVASKAIQIHGGAGYLNDYAVEKIYRDVRVYQIYEGTSEVQKIVIARLLDGLEL
ncbi:MAG TPA: acyl-CoA dehydrogenase family protein [Alphaproteobacteria bacterium]|nr:acyl-CoA dehydrogenase family protein [Alphaproteobacteria bacterium]